MAERVLKIKAVSEVAEAISGLTDVTGSLQKVGTAAIEASGMAKGKWAELEAEWQKSTPTLKGVAAAAFSTESALNAMGRAGTASGLESGLIKSQVALNAFKAKLDEVRAAGGTIDEGMRTSLAVMESAIDAGKNKLVAMKEATVQAQEQLGLLGDAGKKAGAGIEDGTKGAWAALERLGEEGKAAAAALEKMDAAKDSPRELQRNAMLAEVAMNELKASIDKAGASGAKLGPDVGASLTRAVTSITAANTKAAQMRDTLGDMKTRGDQAAKGFESVAGAAGSLEGMLGQLKDTSGPAGQAISDMGFKVVALSAAAKLGYTEGAKLREVLVELGVPLPDLSNKLATMFVNMDKFARGSGDTASAMSVLSGGTFEVVLKLGLLAAGYGKLEQPESAAIKRAREFLALRDQQAAAEAKLQAYFATSGVAWKDGYQELEKLNAALAAGENRLQHAAANAHAYNVELEANGPTYVKLAEQSASWGKNLEAEASRVKAAAAAYLASEEAKRKATEAFASKAIADLAKVEAAHKKVAEASAQAGSKAIASFDAQMKELNSLQISEEEYSARKTALYSEMQDALQSAAAEEQASARATALAQKETQEALATTPERYAAIEKAAAAYNTAIEAGATPTAAMKKTIEELSIGLFDVATSMGKVSEITKSLDGSMTVPIQNVGAAAAEAFKSLEGMKTTALSLVSANDGVAASNQRLAGSFYEVARAAAAAAGSGGGGGNGPEFVGPPNPSGAPG